MCVCVCVCTVCVCACVCVCVSVLRVRIVDLLRIAGFSPVIFRKTKASLKHNIVLLD